MPPKPALRAQIKSRLELLKPEESLFIRERIIAHVAGFVSQRPGRWASYRPYSSEANPGADPLPGVEWVYPKVVDEDLVFYQTSAFIKGRFGLMEPDPALSVKVDPFSLKGILVPALAFDRKGRRLGRGRGYYDRFLANLPAIRVGVCFSAQLLEELPTDPWDANVNVIVTEQSVFEMGV